MSEQERPKAEFTVLLATGEKRTHTLDVPSDHEKAMEFVEFWVDKISLAMTRGAAAYLWFPNPNITYNPDNVVGVEFRSIGAKELEEIITKTQPERIGFIKK